MNEVAPYNNNSSLPAEQRRILLEQEEPTDLRNYWFVIYRHRWVALIFFLLALFLTAISIPWGAPLYTATTTLYHAGSEPWFVRCFRTCHSGG